MAFLLDCVIDDYEVRAVTIGTSRKGNSFRAVKVESKEGHDAEISVTNQNLFASVDGLRKGDLICCRVLAVSTPKRSYIQLMNEPVKKGNSYVDSVALEY